MGVYWIPRLRNSIISVGQMDEGGSCVLIEGGMLKIWDWQQRLLARVRSFENRMYWPKLQVARPLCLTVHQDDEAWRWHKRLGHANFGSLERMSKPEMVRGLPPISHAGQFCDTCVLAKHRRGAFPKQSKYHMDMALELVHGDLCTPVEPTTQAGGATFCYSSTMQLATCGWRFGSQIRGSGRHQAHPSSDRGVRPQAQGVEN
jgi:hypothetical protein